MTPALRRQPPTVRLRQRRRVIQYDYGTQETWSYSTTTALKRQGHTVRLRHSGDWGPTQKCNCICVFQWIGASVLGNCRVYCFYLVIVLYTKVFVVILIILKSCFALQGEAWFVLCQLNCYQWTTPLILVLIIISNYYYLIICVHFVIILQIFLTFEMWSLKCLIIDKCI